MFFLTFPLLFLLLIILFVFFILQNFFILHFSLSLLLHIWSGINTYSMKFKWPKANFYQRNSEYGWLKSIVRSKTYIQGNLDNFGQKSEINRSPRKGWLWYQCNIRIRTFSMITHLNNQPMENNSILKI